MANYRGRLLETIKTSAKANVDRHLMNAEVLLGSHVGVAEHSDFERVQDNAFRNRVIAIGLGSIF